MTTEVQALIGGCGCQGDIDGLRAALGDGAIVVSSYARLEDGHHGHCTIWQTVDGRIIYAECGGLFDENRWTTYSSYEDADLAVPHRWFQ